MSYDQAHRSARHLVGTVVAGTMLAVALCGCRTAPDLTSKDPPLPDAFSTSGTELLDGKWWEVFGDETLDGLVEQSLEKNFSLRAAADRIDQATAQARAAGAKLTPTLAGTAGAEASQTERGGRRTESESYSLGLSASYEVDLWGKLRSSRDASRLEAEATREDYEAAAISLSASVATVWMQLQEQTATLAILRAQAKSLAQELEMIETRQRRGQATATDVLQQKQLLKSVDGDIELTQSAIGTLRNALAVLVVETPGSFDPQASGELPELPDLPATGVPAETVAQRPDVTRAWLSVEAADARLASAIADQFPTLSLTVSGQTSAEKVGDLFNDWLGNLAGNLIAPILDGGARRAAVDQKTAATAEAVNRYGQTVLEAMQEIEDALGREEHLKRYLLSVQNQERLGAEAVERARAAYLGGRSSYFRVLDASRSQLDLARGVIAAHSELIRNRVDLYRALAGGIEP